MALEIKHEEIIAHPQYLAQVIIAVDARRLERHIQVLQLAEALGDLAPLAQHQAGRLQHLIGKAGDAMLELVEHLPGPFAQAQRQRGEVSLPEHAGPKLGPHGVRGEVQMRLRRPSRQHDGRLVRKADRAYRLGLERGMRPAERAARPRRENPRGTAFVVAAELLKHPRPAVALIVDRNLRYGDMARFALAR